MYSLSGIIRERKIQLYKIKCVISIFIILVGSGILLYPKISNYFAEKNQVEMIRSYKETIVNMEEEQINLEYEKARQYNENINGELQNNKNDYNEILNLSKNGIMAYLEIPKISAKLPIYHGTADDVMKKGVGHLENTSLPIGGESTHCVLTGHTGLIRTEIFTRLDELEINDYFYLNILEEKLTYQVFQIKVVLPTETKDLEVIEGKDFVTLITCTPYGINTHRLLVQGKRVTEGDIYEVSEENSDLEKTEYEQKKKNRIRNYYGIMILLIVFAFFMICVKKIDF